MNEYVNLLLEADHKANIMVVGDLNTFQFTDDLTKILPGTGESQVLTNLVDTLEDYNVYTFIFDGNSQVLDHFFVTDNLVERRGKSKGKSSNGKGDQGRKLRENNGKGGGKNGKEEQDTV